MKKWVGCDPAVETAGYKMEDVFCSLNHTLLILISITNPVLFPMDKLFAEVLKIRNLFGVAIFSLILLYFFKDIIQALALTGDSGTLNLLLGFLFFMTIGVLGIAGYYAIAEKEIEKGSVTVNHSKKVDTQMRGGGTVTVRDSEEVKTDIDNSGTSSDSGEKKT
ncbi:MAG: hypothetical protein OHK0019_14750 [Saprospiraceae bacterium]